MADKPIIFSGPMIRALLDGTKTQTRRALKPQPTFGGYYVGNVRFEQIYHPDNLDPDCYARFSADAVGGGAILEKITKLHFTVGNLLWVREAWTTRQGLDETKPSDMSPSQSIGYIADDEGPWLGRTRASIHMPRWASRLTLLVTDVRVQGLREIGEIDAFCEGCIPQDKSGIAIPDFRTLWDSINGKTPGKAWANNPWVVALTFQVLKCNIDEVTK